MDLKKAKKLIYGLVVAAFLSMALGFIWETLREWLLYGFMILMGTCFACLLLFWRCPHCGRHLGRMDNAKFCKHCGEKLYGEK